MAVNLVTVTGNLETLSGATPSLGRVWFKLNRPDWNLSGDIFAPEYIEVIASAGGAFSVTLQSTDDLEAGASYSVILKYREPLDNKDREYTVGQFMLPAGGPYQLGDLLTVPFVEPVPADILALCQAYAVAAKDSATDAAASAAQAALYDGPWVDDVAALLADTSLTYTAGTASSVAAGDYVRTRREGLSYLVAASGASDQNVTTAGGVKLYEAPSVQHYTTVADLRAAPAPSANMTYRLKLADDVYEYAFVAGSTTPEDLVRYTVINSTKTAGRYIAVNGRADTFYVLAMGQSNAVGADSATTGSMFAANSRVQVWRESTSTWVTPAVGTEPFNVSGSNNAPLDFCNRLAEETGKQVRLILIADGSTNISAWTGTPADRTISVGNRPKWVEMKTALDAIGVVPDAMIWIQGEANGGSTVEAYAVEYAYLLSQMDGAGYLAKDTPVIVSQLYQGIRSERGNLASQNAILANANIRGLQDIGDQRLRIANSSGLAALTTELTEGTQKAGVHFTDAALRTLGRDRLWAAYRMAVDGYQHPVDFGLEVSRTHLGLIGSHLWGGGDVDATFPNATVLPISRLGQLIDVRDTKTLVLPDFTHPTNYSSALKARVGLCVYFRLTQVGSCTISIEAGGTGGLLRQGALYGAGALEASITISAAGASNTNYVHMARWTGARWDITRITA